MGSQESVKCFINLIEFPLINSKHFNFVLNIHINDDSFFSALLSVWLFTLPSQCSIFSAYFCHITSF